MPEQAKVAPVPKFASFKSTKSNLNKRAATTDTHEAAPIKRRKSISPLSDTDGGSRSLHRRHHHHHRHHGRHHRDQSARETDNPASQAEQLTINDLYTVDLNGDSQNLTYQRLHRYSIPQYRRAGSGRILGLDLRFRIDKDASLEDIVHLIDTRSRHSLKKERLLLRKSKSKHFSDARLLSQPDSNSSSFDLGLDFVALRATHARTRGSSPNTPSELLDQVRGLEDTPASAIRPTDPDLEYLSSEEEPDTAALETEVRLRSVDLSRKAKMDPTNVQHWLDLVEHQRDLVRPAAVRPASDDFTDTERRALADIRLDIFEKAAKHIPTQGSAARERLFCSMFLEARIVWDTPKYLARLNGAIREIPSSFPLWNLYLDASQTNPTNFRFENSKNFYLQSLQSIHHAHSVHAAHEISHAEATKDMYLYIMIRYTTFLRQSGYEELSLATWQALFEFHLFRPALDRTATDQALASLEIFWDSEAPRFGDADARGWRNHGPTDTPLESAPCQTESSLNISRPFRSFATSEQSVNASLRFPGRTIEDVASEDPFHIVFFSDLKETLQTTPLLLSHRALTDAFLCFLGLPLTPSLAMPTEHYTRAQAWKQDGFIGQGLLGDMTIPKCETMPANSGLQNSAYSVQALFSDTFPSISSLCGDHRVDGVPPSLEAVLLFARNTLASIVGEHPEDEGLTEYYLAFLCQYFPKEAGKAAKAALKKRQTSLRLYNACAMVEATLGRLEKANHIWAGAIKMKESFSLEAQQDAVSLWQSWTWCEMQQGNSQTALRRLISFDGSLVDEPATTVLSSSATLRVRRTLKEGFAHALTHHNMQLASSNVDCLALLAYLSQGDSLPAALAVIDEHCVLVQNAANHAPGDMTLELLHQSKAAIIAHHTQQRRPYKPSLIRSQLEASIHLFPNNTKFLALYSENEARFRIDDRVRALLRETTTNARKRSPLVLFTFQLDRELSRFETQAPGSTSESVRATFRRALLAEGSEVAHSKALWTRWLRFEEGIVRRLVGENPALDGPGDETAVERWRDVFLGGLRYLPWVKDWILYGLWAFDCEEAYAWDPRELRRLYSVLHERELRCRVEGLEDLLDDVEAEGPAR